eukprot:TRINITY_DN223_c0_g1_i2.p2 TRINITY_DN223_c0_g1~~TRINITY_DN223_c0_g1_i2.p2  ORF type:complete len:360 (+),score=163.19 TRINITY_DN223_c0_g1_i2:73-1152(+)
MTSMMLTMPCPYGFAADCAPVRRESSVSSGSSEASSCASSSAQSSAAPGRFTKKGEDGKTLLLTPWYPQGVSKKGQRMDSEIEALMAMLELTHEETGHRHMVRSMMQQAVVGVLPTATVKVFGSFAYGVSLPSSALDLVVELGDAGEMASVSDVLHALSCMGMQVQNSVVQAECAFAKVHVPSVGLTANVSFSVGPSSVRKCVAHVRKQMEAYPAAKPVFAICRLLLQQARCGDAATSGLPSYALLCMILDFCATYNHAHDASKLLLAFMRKHATGGPSLVVADPLAEGNDLAEGCRRLPQIRSVFVSSVKSLEKWTTKLTGFRGRTPLSSVLSYTGLWTETRPGTARFASPAVACPTH